MPESGRHIYTPKEAFSAEVDGYPYSFTPGRDLVREGHELLERFPQLFELVDVRFEVEEASAAPGSKRQR